MKKRDMQIHINKLEETLRQKGEGRVRKSVYFVLLNPNTRATPNMTDADIRRELVDIIKFLGEHLDKIITFNKTGHKYTKEYIDVARLRFAIEKGYGRKNKNGQYPEDGGTVHAHVVIYIEHRSNITITQESISDLLQPEFNSIFGKNAFISKPRLIQQDQTEDYMTKSETYRNGFKWKTLNAG
jgi:hypothetical protein